MGEMSKKELKELRKLEEMRRNSMEKKANMTKWIAIGGISTIFLGFFLFLNLFEYQGLLTLGSLFLIVFDTGGLIVVFGKKSVVH